MIDCPKLTRSGEETRLRGEVTSRPTVGDAVIQISRSGRRLGFGPAGSATLLEKLRSRTTDRARASYREGRSRRRSVSGPHRGRLHAFATSVPRALGPPVARPSALGVSMGTSWEVASGAAIDLPGAESPRDAAERRLRQLAWIGREFGRGAHSKRQPGMRASPHTRGSRTLIRHPNEGRLRLALVGFGSRSARRLSIPTQLGEESPRRVAYGPSRNRRVAKGEIRK